MAIIVEVSMGEREQLSKKLGGVVHWRRASFEKLGERYLGSLDDVDYVLATIPAEDINLTL